MQDTIFASGTSHFVRVDGIDVHYRRFGAPSSDRPVLLFVHGMWAHARWWDHIAPYFLQDFQVAAMDLGGMGDSGWRPAYSVANYGQQILAVLNEFGSAPATVVAHSFGGTPTMFACYFRPGAIGRAVIVDSRLYLPSAPLASAEELRQLNISRKFYKSRDEAIGRYRLIPPGRPVDKAIIRHIAEHGLFEEPAGWTWKFDPAIDPLMRADAERFITWTVGTPIDYIFGENSDVVSADFAEVVASHFPNCGMPIVIPGCNHHILLEAPAVLVSTLRALFSRPVGAAGV